MRGTEIKYLPQGPSVSFQTLYIILLDQLTLGLAFHHFTHSSPIGTSPWKRQAAPPSSNHHYFPHWRIPFGSIFTLQKGGQKREKEKKGKEKENFQLAKLHSSKKKIKISFHSLVILLIWFDSKNNGEHDGDKGGERLWCQRKSSWSGTPTIIRVFNANYRWVVHASRTPSYITSEWIPRWRSVLCAMNHWVMQSEPCLVFTLLVSLVLTNGSCKVLGFSCSCSFLLFKWCLVMILITKSMTLQWIYLFRMSLN